jgi:predicted peptidase
MAYPELFAAIAPCCGGGMAWNAGVLTMPVWAFHGELDREVSPIQTTEMVERLKLTNPNVRCTIYEGVGHDSWTRAFSEELLQWFFSHRK